MRPVPPLRHALTALLSTCLALSLLAAPARAVDGEAKGDANKAAQPFELKDGDRVVFIGGTFMERESQFGYIETMLTTRFPDRNVTFRNLGYAGDTVGVEARRICRGWATFGGPDEGFNRLKALIAEIKPTVVFAAYGMGESFGGEAKLPEFVQKYNRLLDMLTSAGGQPKDEVRVVLIGPNYHEHTAHGAGAGTEPDRAAHNREIERYSAAVADIARSRGYRYVDLYTATRPFENNLPAKRLPITDNGIHPTPEGYQHVSRHVASSLGLGHPVGQPTSWSLEVVEGGGLKAAAGTNVGSVKQTPTGYEFQVTGQVAGRPHGQIRGLAPGEYLLRAGDKRLRLASAEKWAAGVDLATDTSPASGMEELRKLIVAKNFDYFNYWRPQNDTYILGYRKKEQGQNAVEIPQFKPLVEAKEAEIAKLRVPPPVTYTLEKQPQ